VILIASVGPAHGRVRHIKLSELIKNSDLILIVHVSAVSMQGGLRIATILPARVFKGTSPGRQASFLIEKTWACDASDAVAGEDIILFLERVKTSQIDRERGGPATAVPVGPFYRIAHSGYGRMVIRSIDEKEYVPCPGCVRLPERIPIISRAQFPSSVPARFVRVADILREIPTK